MHRRDVLRTLAWSGAFFTTPGLFAEQLALTPAMTEGPFYPDRLPLDTDNDLLLLNDSLTPAVGEITHLQGRVLDAAGNPVRNAFVEIWQCDHNGAYLHSGTTNADKRDPHFQGYGRMLTDSAGQYYFRTIKPVPYPGRTPHIHFGVSRFGKRALTTQLFVKDHPQNAEDGLLRGLREARDRDALMGDFQPIPDSPLNELAVRFDIVLGRTPTEGADGQLQPGLGRPERESAPARGRPRGT